MMSVELVSASLLSLVTAAMFSPRLSGGRSGQPSTPARAAVLARRYQRVALTALVLALLTLLTLVGGAELVFAQLLALVLATLVFLLLRDSHKQRRGGVTLVLAAAATLTTLALTIVLITGLLPAVHLLLAALNWGLLLALTGYAAWGPQPALDPVSMVEEGLPARPSLLADYISLTKPKVLSLLLVTTLAAMFITPEGTPGLALVLWTLLGGYLAAGGAGAINCAFDGDIDNVMGRTSRRPVPSGRITPRQALIFGIVLNVLAFAVLALFATPLAAVLALVGTVYYGWFYTVYLKRNTWQNIVIGGGAGAMPPLVGWTAVTGELSLAAIYLFIIIFYWTPPHFWALALIKEKDYARAGVPMLPVVAGEAETRWQIVLYSLLMVALSFMLTALQAMGLIYLVLAAILGAIFLIYAWRVWRVGGQGPTWGLYKYSLLYLALLFGAMVLDRAILT